MHTLPTFDSCTKCLSGPGKIHNHTVPGHGCVYDHYTTERSFDSQATWVIDVLGLLY